MPDEQTVLEQARSEYATLQQRKEEVEREWSAINRRLAELKRFIERPPAEPFDAHGLTISEAAEKLLRIHHKPCSSQEIVEALISGGVALPEGKAIGRVEGSLKLAMRRFKCLDGCWGLAEWTNEYWAAGT